ncbi:MAG: lytic murein transglycosylase B [Thiomonas sp.]
MPSPHLRQTAPRATSRRCWLRATAATALAAALPRSAWAQSGPTNAPAPPAAASTPARAMLGDWPAQDAQALIARIAQRNGLPQALVERLLTQARYEPTVARLILPGPPAKKNWRVYRSRFLDSLRIGAGSDFLQEFGVWFRKAEQRYGVPPHIVAGILGVETIYGRNMGNFRVVDALSTLALRFPAQAPRDRSGYFGAQLGDFFQWCAQDGRDPLQVRGSYAGAIGMPQFMPENILKYAVDFDQGGHIDLINDPADAIGSVASYLAAKGWVRGQPAHFALQLPRDLPQSTLDTLLAPDITPTFTADQLAAMGLPLLPQARAYPGKLAVVQLPNAGAAPDYVLGTDNFYVITRYNQSAFYALAVIELGEIVAAAAASAGVSRTPGAGKEAG